MSWDIIYRRQFVRVNDEVIPMIESGSNNCYEIGSNGRNGRRARDWWRHTYFLEDGALSIKPELLGAKMDAEFEKYVERYSKEDGVDRDKVASSWSYYTGVHVRCGQRTTFNQYKAFYMNGCKEAMTVEELAEYNVGVSVGVYYYKEEDILSKGLEILPTVSVSSTQQLIDTFKRFKKYYQDSSRVIVDFDDKYTLERMFKERVMKKKRRERVSTNSFFTLKAKGIEERYFIKTTKYGYQCALNKDSGKKFLTESKAKAFLKRNRYKDKFEVVPVNLSYSVMV